jgi:hypothetical protein
VSLFTPDDRPDPRERFRADLASYLAELPGGELADLLDRLPDPELSREDRCS